MRRDICFYFDAGVQDVYQAYMSAASNKPFERSCNGTPYHTIAFGIGFSWKYNINGGSCNIHLMPQGNGTAVNMRFTIAQAMGANCERYANDLNNALYQYLPVRAQSANYNVDDFLNPANQVTDTPAFRQEPTPSFRQPPAPAAAAAYCSSCGNPLVSGSRFCAQCGTPVSAPAVKICPNCNTQATPEAAFCIRCGTKL